MLLENWVLVKGEQLAAPAVHFGAFKEGAAAWFLSLAEPYAGDHFKGDEMGYGKTTDVPHEVSYGTNMPAECNSGTIQKLPVCS
jgi:hypothetical protein